MGDSETGQVSADAAKVYEQYYLPALFDEWAPRVVEAARISADQQVLDVACGTGVLALAALEQVGADGTVVGVDNNEGMLSVARRKTPGVAWRAAPAESLPLDDNSFDCVVSQFGLMYFEDRQRALQEMRRVLRPGGCIAVAVWDKLENIPGLAAEEQLWQRLYGDEPDEAPYSLGDTRVLRQLFADAGLAEVDIETCKGMARFASVEAWMYAGVMGWTEDDMLDDDQYQLLLKEAARDLGQFVIADGSVAFPTSAHIASARIP